MNKSQRTTTKKKPSRKKAAKKRASKKSQPKKAKKKAAAKRRVTPGNGGKGRPFLDRRIYAEARARGAPKTDAAKLAGSKGRTPQSLSQAGANLEADPFVADMIEAIKAELIIREIADPWEKAKAVMEQMLTHPEWRARGTAGNFFAKVVGGYAPEKVEHSGNIQTAEPGEIEKLSKEERAKLRALLGKRKK